GVLYITMEGGTIWINQNNIIGRGVDIVLVERGNGLMISKSDNKESEVTYMYAHSRFGYIKKIFASGNGNIYIQSDIMPKGSNMTFVSQGRIVTNMGNNHFKSLVLSTSGIGNLVENVTAEKIIYCCALGSVGKNIFYKPSDTSSERTP